MVALSRALRWHRPLMLFSASMVALAAVAGVVWQFDDRTLLGAPIWAKPIKFAISFAAYSATSAWVLHHLPSGTRLRRAGWWSGTVIVVASVIEMIILTGQAARGVRSHYNDDSSFDASLYSLMGATVAMIYLATLVIGALLLSLRSTDPVVASSLRMGLFVSVLGMSVGFLLVANGGHSVGVPDGGPGLPFTNWSTTGGDLRIGHFVGMHALQALPLLAITLGARPFDGLDPRAPIGVLRTAGAAYAALVVLVTWQALRAQPLLSPDVLTLAAAAGLIATTALGLTAVVRGARAGSGRSPSPRPGFTEPSTSGVPAAPTSYLHRVSRPAPAHHHTEERA